MDDTENTELHKRLEKKNKRKARPGGWPRFRNIPRSWLHQGFTYRDRTQRLYRMVFETTIFFAFPLGFKLILHQKGAHKNAKI